MKNMQGLKTVGAAFFSVGLVCAQLVLSGCGASPESVSYVGADDAQAFPSQEDADNTLVFLDTHPTESEPELPQGADIGTESSALTTVLMMGEAIPNNITLNQPFELSRTPDMGRCGSKSANATNAHPAADNSCVFPEGRFQKSTWTWSVAMSACGLGLPSANFRLGPGIGNGPGQCSAFDAILGNCDGRGPFERDYIHSGAFAAFASLNAEGLGIKFVEVQDDDATADIYIDCNTSAFTSVPNIIDQDGPIAYGTPAGLPVLIRGPGGQLADPFDAAAEAKAHCASTGETLKQQDLGMLYYSDKANIHINMPSFFNTGSGWMGCLAPFGSSTLAVRQAEVVKYAEFTVLHELGHGFSFQHTRFATGGGELMSPFALCHEITDGTYGGWPSSMVRAMQLLDTRQDSLTIGSSVSAGLECEYPEL